MSLPPRGFGVQLSSGNTAVATVPASVTVGAGTTTVKVTVTTVPVTRSTPVTITATAGGVGKTAQLTVAPSVSFSVTLKPTDIAGGQGSTGQVTLSGPALSGGFAVQLLSSNTAVARVPASVTVPAGSTTASFTVMTVPVMQPTPVTITTTAGGVTKTTQLTVSK